MKKIKSLLLLLLISSFLVACNSGSSVGDQHENGIYASFETNHGNFLVQLYHEKAPLTVANFVSLAEGKNTMLTDESLKGKPFYDGLIFHRIIKDFMIQGGDPDGLGSGGPGYSFPDEFDPSLVHDSKGILSMANSGPATNGSQFFITLKDTPWLNNRHTVFGKVVEGQEVVDEIGLVETGERDKPLADVVINKVTILRKGRVKLNSFENQLKEIDLKKEKELALLAKINEKNEKNFVEIFENAKLSESGIKIAYIEQTEEEKPEYLTEVNINYAGFLEQGKLFDSNIYEIIKENNPNEDLNEEDFRPMRVPIDPEIGLIPGFKEAMLGLKYGEKIYVLIPSHLAYGENGVNGVIPPNSDLVFYIEMHRAE